MQESPKTTQDALTLGDLLRILRNRWPYILIVFVLAVVVTATITFFMPKSYRAEATIRVEKPISVLGSIGQALANTIDPYFVREQMEILQSEKVLGPVIDDLDLTQQVPAMLKIGAVMTKREVYTYLTRQMLSVDGPAGTSLIVISVEAVEDPDLAMRVANRIAARYEQNRLDFYTSDQRVGIEKLEAAVTEQEAKVKDQRDEVERLRNLYKIDDSLRVEALSGDIENIRQMERTLLALRVDAISQRTEWEEFRRVLTGGDLRSIDFANSKLIQDANILRLGEAYLLAEQNYNQVQTRLGEAHPDFQAVASQRDTIFRQLEAQLRGYEKGLEISLKQADARVNELERQLTLAREAQLRLASSGRREFDEAVNRLRQDESVLDALRISYRQREIDLQVPKRAVELLTSADRPDRPSKPNWWVNMILATLGGLVVGCAFAFAAELIDTSFRSIEDMERKLQVPILGVVSRHLVMVTPENYNRFESEAYRVIQTNLDLAGGENTQVIAVQSAGPGEGKSTTLYNLGAAMALSGQKVLVIDTDLRRPSQHRLFECSRKPGMIDVLQERAKLTEVIVPSKIPGLSLLPAGSGASFSFNILHSRAIDGFVRELRGSYDRILMDSPPVVGISDSSVIARMVDGVIFVVQHRRNPQTMTLRARQIIQSVGGQVLGAVLNQVPTGGSEDYNYYTSNYHYYGNTKAEPEARTRKPSRQRREEPPANGAEGELLSPGEDTGSRRRR